ncbi:MAG: anthranilate synthase component 1 [Candidatus Kentron sp. G]|nr:MAG: anthranilate synthase component 1 [Candidatus Kentron sp. G]VFM99981.1 MAG: anthranilate synthase component 1 [Candidatus Kentron sp. G]VFN01235.1 MAG: anthranilate synthase component 1 [Candidatus Kentron sp. G]
MKNCFQRRFPIFPDLLSLHFAHPDRYPFLLESTSHRIGYHASRSRYDILFAFPEDRLVQDPPDDPAGDGRRVTKESFLDRLDAWFAKESDGTTAGGLSPSETPLAVTPEIPFQGGWFLYLGYELAAQIEPVLGRRPGRNTQSHVSSAHRPANMPPREVTRHIDFPKDDNPVSSPWAARIEERFPIAAAWRVPAAIIRDKHKRETILVTESHRATCMKEMERDLLSAGPFLLPVSSLPPTLLRAPVREDPADEFLERIAKIKHYIREGDVFQVNLSRGWRANLHEGIASAHIYHRLRRQNPGAFAGLAVWDDFSVISSSPERLVRIRDGTVETRPIAGTYPRDPNLARDRRLSDALMAHPKERAEHIMLIDLERNDLGRVCRPGSVRVDELMVLESYAHVHHIVSNVCGKLQPDTTPGQVLRAIFPGGTITGCPKVRCMEIIAELERILRGPYTGAMGYLNRNGSADLNILIRTFCRQGDSVSLRAGSGIVADSVPERELRETRHKARGPLDSLL